MTTFTVHKDGQVNAQALTQELTAVVGVPFSLAVGSDGQGGTVIEVTTDTALDAGVESDVDGVVAAHVYAPPINEIARVALQTIDIDDKLALVALGKQRMIDFNDQVAAIDAATTLAEIKPLLHQALFDASLIMSGTLDELDAELKRWRKLLQVLAMTSDTTIDGA